MAPAFRCCCKVSRKEVMHSVASVRTSLRGRWLRTHACADVRRFTRGFPPVACHFLQVVAPDRFLIKEAPSNLSQSSRDFVIMERKLKQFMSRRDAEPVNPPLPEIGAVSCPSPRVSFLLAWPVCSSPRLLVHCPVSPRQRSCSSKWRRFGRHFEKSYCHRLSVALFEIAETLFFLRKCWNSL